MRIVFVVTELKNGGAERETVMFAGELAELGQEVHIVCVRELMGDYPIDPRIHLHYIPYTKRVQIPKVRVLFRWWHAMPGLRSLHADILIPVCLPLKYYPCLKRAALFSRTKLLYAVRNNQEKKYVCKEDRRKWRLATYYVDGIWIQTEAQRSFFPKVFQKKIFCVPNILDPKFLRIPLRERKEIRRFVSVGRFHPQKNQKLLIEAFAGMIERTGDTYATLTIYGQRMPWDEPIDEELNSLIQRYQLKDRIFLPGRVTEIEKCYEEADAFVFSSNYEGLPNALMEAMAAGLPCISTDCPTGPSSLIASGENGLLIPVGDAEAMARAMEYLIDHPQQAQRFGREARRRMSEWKEPQEQARALLTNLRRLCI